MWAHNYGSGCFAAVRWPWYMHMYCTHWMTFILLPLSTSYKHIYTHSLNQHLCYLWIAALANDGYIDAVDNDTVGLLLQVFTFSEELSSKEWFHYMPLHSNDQMEWDDVVWHGRWTTVLRTFIRSKGIVCLTMHCLFNPMEKKGGKRGTYTMSLMSCCLQIYSCACKRQFSPVLFCNS